MLAIKQLKEAAQEFRAWARQNPWSVFLLSAAAIVLLWILIRTLRLDNAGFREKSLWDWMELLLVPTALALAGLWFTRAQKRTELEIASQEREVDREVARDHRHQGTLEAYFDRMSELVFEKDLGASELEQDGDDPEGRKQGDLAASMARARTLAVLRTLDPARVNAVFRFLLDMKVDGKSLAEIVPLAGGDLRGVEWPGPEADLRGVSLSEANLRGANLSGAFLGGADLSRAQLNGARLFGASLRGTRLLGVYLSGANLNGADLSGANLSGADLSWATLRWANLSEAYLSRAHLSEANLSGAVLSGADLRDANLSGANLSGAKLSWSDLSEAYLSGADLSGADLSGANLVGATVSTDQLLQAHPLEDATMPDGTKYEEWINRQETEQAESHGQDD